MRVGAARCGHVSQARPGDQTAATVRRRKADQLTAPFQSVARLPPRCPLHRGRSRSELLSLPKSSEAAPPKPADSCSCERRADLLLGHALESVGTAAESAPKPRKTLEPVD